MLLHRLCYLPLCIPLHTGRAIVNSAHGTPGIPLWAKEHELRHGECDVVETKRITVVVVHRRICIALYKRGPRHVLVVSKQ